MREGGAKMKFEFDNKEDDRECVAYIDGDGDLIVKGSNDQGNICIAHDGFSFDSARFCEALAVKKFYRGDKVTITF